MLDAIQFDHVSVLITDLRRAREFYGELLGLREIAKPRTFAFRVIWFDLGTQQLHLLLKPQPDTLPADWELELSSLVGRREPVLIEGFARHSPGQLCGRTGGRCLMPRARP